MRLHSFHKSNLPAPTAANEFMKGRFKQVILGKYVPYSVRPRVSDDNPYSEALFRTLKYRPWYPNRPFQSIEEARAWVADFVAWYNFEHLHSAIGFVTPDDRHAGRDVEILANRRKVYERARQRRPERWTGAVRNWDRVESVTLNPGASTNHTEVAHAAAA